MRPITEKEYEIFEAYKEHPALLLLLEVIKGEVAAQDELIVSSITDMTGIVSQQQAIGAKRALQDILTKHKVILKEAVKHA